ncbi:MAG: DUF4351 domain-containing protein, partial [Bacillota bacterium]|nr:DUF4351 domain-containing protein [Bacillota bacterium]
LDLIKDLPEGDEIDMCEGMERMAEGFRNEGRNEGRAEGKLEEKKNTLLSLLNVKLGKVSRETENTIRSCTTEKLNQLTLSIFDIQNENDILNIIH